MSAQPPLFDRLAFRDPLTGAALEPLVSARTPAGVPVCGALRVTNTTIGYPIVDCIARLTPELARKHASWLEPFGLTPPAASATDAGAFQAESTVDSFGWQWTWNSAMRSDADLRMRVADRFGLTPESFAGLRVLDAGAGAGDQSRYLSDHGASVVSVDLSSAIEVVAAKLRMRSGWVGVQADITALPFEPAQFDAVYCEGVIQHTRDSTTTVRELVRVARPGGRILATHYVRLPPATAAHRMRRRLTSAYYGFLRRRLGALDRYSLLLATGNLAALSYVPLLGRVVTRTGTALRYDLMPDFKTTWTNTFDYWGQHEFQRFATPDEFCGYFEAAGDVDIMRRGDGVVLAVKRA
jgi:ubiquinone/menaquinone biosynthesis C-methylase UbiE